MNNITKNKLYYLASYPFGESVLNFFRQHFTEYEWQSTQGCQFLKNVTVIADSNAFTKQPHMQLENCRILAINPIWRKTSAEPIWLSIPMVRNSFLKRMVRYRRSSLVDSYLHPYPENSYRKFLMDRLNDKEVWHKLLQQEPITKIRQLKNNLYLLTNDTDALRNAKEQNAMMTYQKIWEWQSFSHSVLAMTQEQRLEMKQILHILTQDKGL